MRWRTSFENSVRKLSKAGLPTYGGWAFTLRTKGDPLEVLYLGSRGLLQAVENICKQRGLDLEKVKRHDLKN